MAAPRGALTGSRRGVVGVAAVFVIVAVTFGACGASSNGLAERQLLRVEELGPGWRTSSPPNLEVAHGTGAGCETPDLGLSGAQAKAVRAFANTEQRLVLQHAVYLLKDADRAAAELRRYAAWVGWCPTAAGSYKGAATTGTMARLASSGDIGDESVALHSTVSGAVQSDVVIAVSRLGNKITIVNEQAHAGPASVAFVLDLLRRTTPTARSVSESKGSRTWFLGIALLMLVFAVASRLFADWMLGVWRRRGAPGDGTFETRMRWFTSRWLAPCGFAVGALVGIIKAITA
jgi:hypothetical protein